MSENPPIKLRIPRQDLAAFELFPLDADSARQWAHALPVTNTRLSVSRLRDAVRDLNRVQIAAADRFGIMEELSPSLQVAVTNLSRRFLNQPLVLPEEPRQLAELAENLYSAFSTAYTLVAVHAIQQREQLGDVNPARLTCESLQRAISFAGRRMLQTFQLYQNVEPGGWLTLHQLYALGERQRLAELPVRDQHNRQVTLQESYLQALLLGCCKANQLRQSDLVGVHRGLQEWSGKVRLLGVEDADEALFMIDLNGDHPPVYNTSSTQRSRNQRYIDTRELVDHLEQLRERDRASGRLGLRLDDEITLPSNLLDHLIASLGSHSLRNFSRAAGSDTELEVAVGLSSAHYHVAGGKPFAELLPRHLLAAASHDPFTARDPGRDHWEKAEADDIHRGEADANSHTGGPPVVEMEDTSEALSGERHPGLRFPVYRVSAINASPGGYCLEWTQRTPPNLRSGDVMCVREPGQREWVIAAVRWVSALEQANTLVGVELLSPKAMPYGARTVGQRGALSEPMRVLLLPEIKLVGKPHTLITPRTGFRERQKVVLLRQGEEFLVQLQRQVGAAPGFSQFDFRYIRELEQNNSAIAEPVELPRPAFDSLWSEI
ncbi:GTPase [Parahaliea mediterranea]|uniref:GTPase n=1 Tax=Parahaliea mediterranea TaxID=651086 RepID=A0A939IP01_9GAMM|nr:GTPase [Parahaliea mediterranea]MBN7799080.1 GTPase [Parahaliea mediterranea]